jgi:hypothetical protein
MGDISKNYGGDQNIGLFSRAPVAADKRFPVGYLWIDTSVSPYKGYTLMGIVGGLAQWSASGSGAGTGSGLSEYLPGTTYVSGDIVNYHGILYKCVAVSTIGEQPDLHPAVWELYNRKVNFTSITDPSKGVSATMLLPIKTHIDSVGHGLIAGTKVRFVGADLPAPLAELTDYTVCLAPGADWFEVETIALTPIQFTTDGFGDYMVISSGACTMTGATDLVNAAAHPMLDGDIVQFTGVDLPVELALLTDYCVINANVDDFQISLLPGGVPIEFSDSGAGLDVAFHQKTSTPIAFTTTLVNSKIHKVATTMINNDTVQFTGLLLPHELVAGTTYYVVNKTADDFEVAPGLGGVAIDFSVAGSGKYHLMNQALTTAILDAYDGIIITLTEAPAVAQTLQVPTIPDKVFIVVNSKTSTHSITVFDDLDSIVIEPGSGVKYFWDGTSWNVLEGVDAKDVTFTPYDFVTVDDVQKAIERVIDALNAKASAESVSNEILPIEIFEDGAVPPAELSVYAVSHHKYRDFSDDDLVDAPFYKQTNVANPTSVGVIGIITDATGLAENDTILFDVKINGSTVQCVYTCPASVPVNGDIFRTDFKTVAFGTSDYSIEVKRVAGTGYSAEVGVVAVEVK